MRLTIGDKAPDFTLSSQDGTAVRLYELLAQHPVVLFFYPMDNTPGCTKEVCVFRDHYAAFQEYGAEVVGISADSNSSHQKFASSYRLPFRLLSDGGNHVRKQFGVPSTFGLFPGRVTYLIDQQGIVRHLFNSQFQIDGHIASAIKALEEIKR